MYKYGEEHPVIFEILLLIAAFAIAAVFNIVGYIFNLHPDISNSAARILTAIALQVVAVHFLIDLTTRIFMEHPSYASPMQLVVFVLVLAVEAAYALWLTVKGSGSGEAK